VQERRAAAAAAEEEETEAGMSRTAPGFTFAQTWIIVGGNLKRDR
jgi:hypothetical protein